DRRDAIGPILHVGGEVQVLGSVQQGIGGRGGGEVRRRLPGEHGHGGGDLKRGGVAGGKVDHDIGSGRGADLHGTLDVRLTFCNGARKGNGESGGLLVVKGDVGGAVGPVDGGGRHGGHLGAVEHPVVQDIGEECEVGFSRLNGNSGRDAEPGRHIACQGHRQIVCWRRGRGHRATDQAVTVRGAGGK